MEHVVDPSPGENSPARRLFPEAGDTPSDRAARAELEKIVASDSFREAEGLKRFLRYAVEHTLAGEGDQLKEDRLRLEVFDRHSGFDPRLDPVVRMGARRPRDKRAED